MRNVKSMKHYVMENKENDLMKSKQITKTLTDIKQFTLRLDEDLFNKIKENSIYTRRSVNAEILVALEKMYMNKGEN